MDDYSEMTREDVLRDLIRIVFSVTRNVGIGCSGRGHRMPTLRNKVRAMPFVEKKRGKDGDVGRFSNLRISDWKTCVYLLYNTARGLRRSRHR